MSGVVRPTVNAPDVDPPETSANLSSYFTSGPASDDIFDTVFEQNLLESPPAPPISVSVPASLPESDITDTGVLNLLRQQDAWLPSEATRKILSSGIKSIKSSDVLEIKPKLSEIEKETASKLLTDPYCDLLMQHLKDESAVAAIRTPPTTGEHVVQSTENLKELVSNGWYRAALDLTRRLLTNWGYGPDKAGAVLTPLSAQVWLTRLVLLIRVRQFDLAEQELETFKSLDAPNVYFEHAPEVYPGRFGSIIPFSLRLLHAEFPFYRGRTEEALDRLYYLLAIIHRIQCNLQKGYTEDGTIFQPESDYAASSLNLWTCRQVRVLSSCLSIYLSELDYLAAVETVHQLAITCNNDPAVLRGLSSVLGRIYLQLGDLETSRQYFARSNPPNHSKQQPPITSEVFHKALISVGRGEYDEAKKLFQEVLSMDPTNVAAANNMVVCSLYLGQMTGAIRFLEPMVTNTLSGQPHWEPSSKSASGIPPHRRFCLHESLIYNLAILYEVESDKATTKKFHLLERIATLPGEPVHPGAFKLSA